jgi:hypothetical protein
MNQESGRALCIRDTLNADRTKLLRSEWIYDFVPMSSDHGTAGYFMHLDGEDMGTIDPDQFSSNFVKTTLTLDEYRKMANG